MVARDERAREKIIDTFGQHEDRLIYGSISFTTVHDEEHTSSIAG